MSRPDLWQLGEKPIIANLFKGGTKETKDVKSVFSQFPVGNITLKNQLEVELSNLQQKLGK